jgi:hypothetical protein
VACLLPRRLLVTCWRMKSLVAASGLLHTPGGQEGGGGGEHAGLVVKVTAGLRAVAQAHAVAGAYGCKQHKLHTLDNCCWGWWRM